MSDPSRTIASPHSVVEAATEPTDPPETLLELLRELEPGVVVVGVPLHMDGSAGEMAEEARAFGRALSARTGIPVEEWDERLTTEGARRALRESGRSPDRDREEGRADMVAATLVLRAYLDSRG